MTYLLLVIIIIVLLLEKYIEKKNIETEAVENDVENNAQLPTSYSKKDYLLTQNELKFYRLLKQITDELDLNLFCQVAMYELINCKTLKDFNRIKSKSIDFVITEKNCKIRCCIELDDTTHYRKNRVQRDEFVNKIFEQTGTKLLRIKVQNFYNLEELEKLIKDSI